MSRHGLVICIALAACAPSAGTEETDPAASAVPAPAAPEPALEAAPVEPSATVVDTPLAAAAPAPGEGTPISVWATNYYVKMVDAVPAGTGVPIRDMQDAVIGPELSASDWCAAAVEGTVNVDGKVFNFAGTRDPAQASCRHAPSSRVRWAVSPFPFGAGSANNALVPFRTIACDMGTVSASEPWVDGGFPRFGQRIFITSAAGTVLPDGSVHDGIFTCGDVGGLITGNHIDVFIGGVRGGDREAASVNPFAFVSNSPDRPVAAVLLPTPP